MYCDQAGSYYVTIQCVTSLNWTSFTVSPDTCTVIKQAYVTIQCVTSLNWTSFTASPDTCTVIKQAVTMLQYNVSPV